MVESIIDGKNGKMIQQIYNYKSKTVLQQSTANEVKEMLISVVNNGASDRRQSLFLSAGGKTGTAQKVKDGKYMSGNYIVSFIGFLPADKPEYLVYVAIDNPKGITQYGGTVVVLISENNKLA